MSAISDGQNTELDTGLFHRVFTTHQLNYILACANACLQMWEADWLSC